MKIQPDLVARVTLLPTDAGGRHSPTPTGIFNCIMMIDGENFDIRLHLGEIGSISPGQTVRVPLSFLDLEHAKKHCSVGKAFSLRELHTMGSGTIDEILFS